MALATLAVFAAEVRAGSFGSEPPNAVLMKYKSVLQVAYSGGGLPYACNNGHLTPPPATSHTHRGGPFSFALPPRATGLPFSLHTRMRLRLQAHPPTAC